MRLAHFAAFFRRETVVLTCPSPEDVKTTSLLYEAGQLLGIQLLDHVIVGDNQFTSLRTLRLGFPAP